MRRYCPYGHLVIRDLGSQIGDGTRSPRRRRRAAPRRRRRAAAARHTVLLSLCHVVNGQLQGHLGVDPVKLGLDGI
eukprot:4418829-Pyramimonas_sp.AAC.2